MFDRKAASYAILAVAEIAKREDAQFRGVRAAELAAKLGLPGAFTAKVMTQLARADVLRSDRGPRGGYRLARAAGEISLLEIVEAVDSGFSDSEATAELQPANRNGGLASVQELMREATETVRANLRSQSVESYVTRYVAKDGIQPPQRP